MEQTLGTRLGAAIGAGIDAIADGFREIGDALQLDVLARDARDGAVASAEAAYDGWDEWNEAKPITSTAVAGAAATTATLAALAGKRGLLMGLTGSAFVGTLLLPLLVVEWMRAEEAPRRRAFADSPATERPIDR